MNMNVCLCVGGKLCIRVCSPHWNEDGVSSQPEGEDKRASCVCVWVCVCVREREREHVHQISACFHRSSELFIYTLSHI